MNATYEPVVTLAVEGPSGQTAEVEAIVDTGFTGFLTLPSALLAELDLPFAYVGRVVLADGSEASFDVHYGTVLWDDQPRLIRIYSADATPLVGMRLLDRYDLYVQVRDGGRVVIKAGE